MLRFQLENWRGLVVKMEENYRNNPARGFDNPLRRIRHEGINAWIKHRAKWTKDDFRRSIMMNQKPSYVDSKRIMNRMHLYENPETMVPKYL